ncbi:arsenosugar biosynthesis radical SAM (seleno)protein ArsS [Geotalea uraniireducens]|uniref:Radical SAM domain protein n=1 Tax=Geotalea uraniireducens (strain Rf4) TaxID=351605 RepID=A5GEA7_GEOUR|nr:arsenosugar biosynthesis radical SAM (seleno)protein ArsS [Geotalea uraniireducens]ABQ25762.1 Radical SAM domain protein [Geotalea uraniireducens Rf4]
MTAMFKKKVEAVDDRFTTFHRLETLQVNLGDLCNLSCAHCHHHASPQGARIMGRDVMEKITAFLARHPGLTLDITGGCPEMNPDFRYFVEASAGHAARRIIRSNLAIALEPGMEWLPDFYREQALVVMASLPCYEAENVEKQRGGGVFMQSIEVLRRLNRQGYGSELELHLVHNPGNGSVSGSRDMLEQHYRTELLQRFGVSFSRLHCMNNTPIGRFRDNLERRGTYQRYIEHLAEKFNPLATEQIMCRTLVSVGWDGVLYNCDFNLAAALPLQRADGSLVTIDHADEAIVPGSGIRMAAHCFSCTAGEGSGCGGSLAASGNKVYGSANSNDQGVSACCQQ